MTSLTSHATLPPFPDNVPTAPLVSVSLAQLEAGDKAVSDAFFKACKELGFFYLDMLGSKLGETIVSEAEQLNKVQQKFFSLPNEVKDVYGRPHLHPFYAYRFSETAVKDENGIPLRGENYNLRKDDILGQCERLACHPMILEHQELFEKYAIHCRAAIDCLLEHLNTHLELPPGTLAKLHRIHERSGDHVRFTQSPPQPWDDERAARAAHTDFGSITILFNWLGGLQIRTADTNKWVYVRPVPGSCIVNLGDAMVKFTGGILRSNIHRVVPAPGEQAGLTRNSLVFFSRPEDAVVLKRLKGGIIDAQPAPEVPEEEMTSDEWIMKKGTGQLPGIYTAKGFEYKGDGAREPLPVAIKA
ncbi:hypothetical protein BCR39DRAFT_471285 [Naematelia encephala]|uniref:Fe2OG dioxygenase domain-containing protein n=1 Tax=Naematelia encephala TaxID=71784 RepID=A0A1Y2ATJ2_9TREE|nr:hypothetical protein BCR39DRAFT_471285 [Naematelia encephala]